jgi:DNA polymerase I
VGYDGILTLRGVAFRSCRAEPFGERFLRSALNRLFADEIPGIRQIYLTTIDALRRRDGPTYEVSSRVRLTKSPERYAETRATRREAMYEALLASGRTEWRTGQRVRVYRTRGGGWGLVHSDEDGEALSADPRDYDVDHYARVLRVSFATRLARAFTPKDFATLFGEADQLSLFARPLEGIQPVLERWGRGLDEA